MQVDKLHGWDMSYACARALQTKLAGKVQRVSLRCKPRLIAGGDCAISKEKDEIICAIVVLSWPGLEIVEIASAIAKLSMPYIPGLLSFREAPCCIEAARRLKVTPDLFIVDGQGIAHPRRLGLAAHLGLFFDRPTIGCAKSRLTGEFEEPATEKGSYSLLTDGGEVIGAVVRSRSNVKPLFVSIGHKCSLEDAIRWVLNCCSKYRLPQPTRVADRIVGKLKHEEGYMGL